MAQAIIAGVFALAGALTTLLVQGRQQRMRAQDERLWSRRADTYVAMLQYQGSGMLEGGRVISKKGLRVRDELTAKVQAFASEEVWNLWQQSAQRASEQEFHVEENYPGWFDRPPWHLDEELENDREYQTLSQARTDASKKLAERIRIELEVHQRGRAAWW